MKSGIVFKLFTLTTALCVLILMTIFVGQTFFFKKYYTYQKMNHVQAILDTFAKEYVSKSNNKIAIERLEQQFYRQHNIWITALDHLGNLKESRDYSIEVNVRGNNNSSSEKVITIPLYSFVNFEDVHKTNELIQVGDYVLIEALKKGNERIPYWIEGWGNEHSIGGNNRNHETWENNQIMKKCKLIFSNFEKIRKENRWNTKLNSPISWTFGSITKVSLPTREEIPRFLYTNHVFIDRIKAFQANLLLNSQPTPQSILYEENDIKYQQIVIPIIDKDGKQSYLFAMSSLQPVDEAIQMIQNYYGYLILFVLLLILLVSFYYSKRIAKPLLRISHTTKKLTELDFSEKIPVITRDEIGDLSRNINHLSDTLYSHIQKLQQDIEKEKQLENTRKEFIAGVSHELKTPLSIIQSCLSILKDGVAIHKKDYYFTAMENEVRKMDLIVIDMLELAKYESGTYQMKVDTFPIDIIIERLCEKLSLRIVGKQLRLHTSFIPLDVVANQHRIEQVIMNFITNAIQYTPENGTIYIVANEDQEYVKISVENTGIHIPQEQLEKIWERFYRGEASRQRSSGGTGLGLAISKKILELHGVPYGVINTEKGVLFYFYLPISRL